MMTPQALYDGFDRIYEGAARDLDSHLSLIEYVKTFSAENTGEPSEIEKEWRQLKDKAMHGDEAAIRDLFLRGLHAENILYRIANYNDIFPVLEKKAEALAYNLREEIHNLYFGDLT